jgi:metallo-beta-lactamase family protein
MVQGGRVEQHIAANISNPYCTILMIGFAAEGTLGRRLIDGGVDRLTIKGKELPVLAKIEKIDVFSGHGDQNDLIDFVKHQDKNILKKIFLTHGEESSMDIFTEKLNQEGYPNIEKPAKGQSYFL